jgi:hypothetical protein
VFDSDTYSDSGSGPSGGGGAAAADVTAAGVESAFGSDPTSDGGAANAACGAAAGVDGAIDFGIGVACEAAGDIDCEFGSRTVSADGGDILVCDAAGDFGAGIRTTRC